MLEITHSKVVLFTHTQSNMATEKLAPDFLDEDILCSRGKPSHDDYIITKMNEIFFFGAKILRPLQLL